jgi:hypothetical protein
MDMNFTTVAEDMHAAAAEMQDCFDICCSTCERSFSPDKLKQANTFDAKGKLCFIYVCKECESDFDELGISFDFTLEKYHKSLAIFS